MKTLFFCNLIPLKTGAFETLLATIGKEFRKAGNEFIVVFSGEPIRPVAEMLRDAGVRWCMLKGWADGPDKERAWGFVFPALRLLRQEHPEVAFVHFGNEMPMLVVVLLSRLMGMGRVKWIWQQHQQIEDPRPLMKYVSKLRLLNLVVDFFVVVYEGGCESMVKRGIPLKKIAVIHNSVAPFTPVGKKGWLRAAFSIPSDDIILVTNGSLIPRKRIDFILRACAQLEKKVSLGIGYIGEKKLEHSSLSFPSNEANATHPFTLSPPWRLLIIGEGPERERLKSLVVELGIADRVYFLGLRNDVREILPECDIYLHASSAETCTYAITESMAAAIPAVVLDAGAAKEQIQSGVSGYVIDRADVDSFSNPVRELMVDAPKRREMGRMAEAQWRNKFASDYVVGAYHGMYKALGI
jgi:glycosyltransferase involved in cell wall biosynthesis